MEHQEHLDDDHGSMGSFNSAEIAAKLGETTPPSDEILVKLRDRLQELDTQLARPLLTDKKAAPIRLEREAVQTEYDALRARALDEEDGEMTPEERQQRIQELWATVEPEDSEEEVLTKMGVLDEDGRFTYPQQLLSEHTNELWRNYLVAVKNHIIATERAKLDHTADNSQLKALDGIRVKRHDEFAKALRSELGMEKNEDNFEWARRLAVKMRESLVPNTGELGATNQRVRALIDEHLNGLQERKAS